MHTISFINWKGGVGKTCTSINTACALAQLMPENRILFIDADKQGNSSSWFEADTRKGSLTDILLDGKDAREVIQSTRYQNIDIIPSDASLIQANYAILQDQERQQVGILKTSLESVQEKYAVCITDYPPDSNLPVVNCLEITDDLIVLAHSNFFSMQGIEQLKEELRNYYEQIGLKLDITGVLFNANVTLSHQKLKELVPDYAIFPPLRGGANTQRFLERVINEKKSIFEISPHSGYAKDFRKFMATLQSVILAHYDSSISVEW